MAHEIIQITLTEKELKNLELLEEAVGDLQVTATNQSNATSTKPLIQRAMLALRKFYDEKKMDRYFKPIYVSFGPLHHVKKFPQGSTIEKAEKFKRRLAAMFIDDSGNQKEDLYKNVKKNIKSLKECYDPIEVVDWEDEELAWMLLVDGCALLLFIYLYVKDKWENVQSVFVIHDLFLLENQLPFQLLEILIDSCTKVPFQKELKASICEFINTPFLSPVKEINHDQDDSQTHLCQRQQEEETVHLLIHDQDDSQTHFLLIHDQDDSQTHFCQRLQEEEPVHLLALLRKKLIGQGVNSQEEEKAGLLEKLMKKWWSSGNKIRGPTFRHVKELKAKGIHFKAKEKIERITEIDFNYRSCMPTVTLAPISVDDTTIPILLNLMAYEMSTDFIKEFEITSYIAFLETLIDGGEDVKELRDAGVLFNGLGSDEAVAEMFNKISDYLVQNPVKYRDLRDRIQGHCNLVWISDVSYFCHTYFRGPWSFLVFVGAVAGLVMTGLQTYNSFN